MARIKSKNTAPEIRVRKHLHAAGLRFRLNAKLPGKPDIVLHRHGVTVFVHGCFWHGHGCKRCYPVKSNAEFWERKIERNQVRDAASEVALKRRGWRVLIVWECELDPARLDAIVAEIRHELPGKSA
jgi:DNA mismatch endonuclease (patch repair protein)